ncbi:myelin transcription factor 1-like protein [Arapaima gigas]
MPLFIQNPLPVTLQPHRATVVCAKLHQQLCAPEFAEHHTPSCIRKAPLLGSIGHSSSAGCLHPKPGCGPCSRDAPFHPISRPSALTVAHLHFTWSLCSVIIFLTHIGTAGTGVNSQHSMTDNGDSNVTVTVLVILLLLLVLLLVYLYKRLNQETDGQYTVHQLVYGKGGALERLNDGARAVESRLGVRLWPHKAAKTEEEEEELKEEEQEQKSQESDVEQGVEGDKEDKAEDNSSDDYSSMEGVDLRERANQSQDQDEDEKHKEKKEEEEVGQDSMELSRGDGPLVDLEPLSGSVIWEDEKKREGKTDGDADLTAL